MRQFEGFQSEGERADEHQSGADLASRASIDTRDGKSFWRLYCECVPTSPDYFDTNTFENFYEPIDLLDAWNVFESGLALVD